MSYFLCMFYKMQCRETDDRIINILNVISVNKFQKIDHNEILIARFRNDKQVIS